MKGYQKRSLMGNFLIQDQWESQKQDGRTSFGGTHHRGIRGWRYGQKAEASLREARSKKEL